LAHRAEQFTWSAAADQMLAALQTIPRSQCGQAAVALSGG